MMNLPERFLEKVNNSEFYPSVCHAVQQYEALYEWSKAPFFPEYTDHGISHSRDVVTSAFALITDAAWELTTPNDLAVLTLAGLLHDCAIHLTESGFRLLITDSYSPTTLHVLDERLWSDLWDEFLFEARRFDGKTLHRLFGNTEPVRLPIDYECLNSRDQLLIGEFLRRHHFRLAHEVMLLGFPGAGGPAFPIDNLDNDIRHLVGIVARSHGHALRDMFAHLKDLCLDSFVVFKQIHPIFIMVLLRISDYLQIQASRAPHSEICVECIRSPLSQGEFRLHKSIKNVHCYSADPEAITVDSLPDSAATFLRFQEWMQGLQMELDISWAVLGEVFGRKGDLKSLGIRIRRVRSNVENIQSLREKVPYIPVRAALEAAHSELLTLLVGPLYGGRAEFGIRELVQNAVDAVNERKVYDTKKRTKASRRGPEVLVHLYGGVGQRHLTITDTGIGMTADTVVNFFLRIGASIRTSIEWKAVFEDSECRSTVLRSGRFGVGVLAAFLLGPELRVRTRHVSAAKSCGIEFLATMHSENIELRNCECHIGTTIDIEINEDIFQWLSDEPNWWDWFCFDVPVVKRRIETRTITASAHLPSQEMEKRDDFNILALDDIVLHWTYADMPALVHNGIRIAPPWETEQIQNWSIHSGHFPMPKLSIFDNGGRFALNLQRTRFEGNRFPFEVELLEEMVKDFLAYLLVCMPQEPISSSKRLDWFAGLPYPLDSATAKAFKNVVDVASLWFGTSKGLGLMSTWNVANSGVKNILFLLGEDKPIDVEEVMTESSLGLCHFLNGGRNCRSYMLGGIIAFLSEDWAMYYGGLWGLKVHMRGLRFLLSEGLANTLKDSLGNAGVRGQRRWDGWVLYATDGLPAPSIDYEYIADELGGYDNWDQSIVGEWVLAQPYTGKSDLLLAKRWREIIAQPLIPYDRDERRTKLAEAFDTLGAYVDRWQNSYNR